jgi:hypothetical protein
MLANRGQDTGPEMVIRRSLARMSRMRSSSSSK